jgi:hypothetical protein
LSPSALDTVGGLILDEFEEKAHGEIIKFVLFDDEKVLSAAAAKDFLATTRLSDEALGKIWRNAEPDNIGYLDQDGFCLVLRVTAHTQAGKRPNAVLARKPAPMPWFPDLARLVDSQVPERAWQPDISDTTASTIDSLLNRCWPNRTRPQLWHPLYNGIQ